MSLFEKEAKTRSDAKRFLEFRLGTESYAVELLKVKEVITIPDMTPLPKAPAYVCGLMNLRGLVLTVVDIRKKLGIVPIEDKSQNAVIILDLGERLVGVVVDSIQKVLNITNESIKPVPDDDGHNTAHLKGVLQHENKLTMWLEPQTLLDKNTNIARSA